MTFKKPDLEKSNVRLTYEYIKYTCRYLTSGEFEEMSILRKPWAMENFDRMLDGVLNEKKGEMMRRKYFDAIIYPRIDNDGKDDEIPDKEFDEIFFPEDDAKPDAEPIEKEGDTNPLIEGEQDSSYTAESIPEDDAKPDAKPIEKEGDTKPLIEGEQDSSYTAKLIEGEGVETETE